MQDKDHDINIANILVSSENMAYLRYLGTAVRNQNFIQEESKKRLNSGSACYHSVQKFLSFCLLSKSAKVRLCYTVILPVDLYGCETSSLILFE
jgi:hypothetical protein